MQFFLHRFVGHKITLVLADEFTSRKTQEVFYTKIQNACTQKERRRFLEHVGQSGCIAVQCPRLALVTCMHSHRRRFGLLSKVQDSRRQTQKGRMVEGDFLEQSWWCAVPCHERRDECARP